MSNHTFKTWLEKETITASCVLLRAYEERDNMLYIDGPMLEKDYLEKVGKFEKSVIEMEIECELLIKKQLMIQAAINRHEPIDEAAIDAELANIRLEMYKEAEGEEPLGFADLTAEKFDELQEIYREIVKHFHPEMNPDMTEVQRQLFFKAQSAYRLRDLDALVLIHDMLFSTLDDGEDLGINLTLVVGETEESDKANSDHLTDYTLAAMIYKNFVQTDEEVSIQEEWSRYKQTTDAVMREMEEMKSQFPYNAAQMLADPEKIEEYKNELSHRMRKATEEKERRTNEIKSMIEGAKARG